MCYKIAKELEGLIGRDAVRIHDDYFSEGPGVYLGGDADEEEGEIQVYSGKATGWSLQEQTIIHEAAVLTALLVSTATACVTTSTATTDPRVSDASAILATLGSFIGERVDTSGLVVSTLHYCSPYNGCPDSLIGSFLSDPDATAFATGLGSVPVTNEEPSGLWGRPDPPDVVVTLSPMELASTVSQEVWILVRYGRAYETTVWRYDIAKVGAEWTVTRAYLHSITQEAAVHIPFLGVPYARKGGHD